MILLFEFAEFAAVDAGEGVLGLVAQGVGGGVFADAFEESCVAKEDAGVVGELSDDFLVGVACGVDVSGLFEGFGAVDGGLDVGWVGVQYLA